jgi:hypothetical protein
MAGMRRRLAAILLVTLALGAGAPVTCTGWEPAAAARMACCKRAQHATCHDQTAADDCCARHEQSRQSGTAIASPVQMVPGHAVVLPAPAFDSTTVARQITAACFERTIARRLHGPPGLLAPPLRI